MISGWILDPDRKKMSKSKGNVVVPTEILDKYGADAVRWRAACVPPRHGLAVRREPDEGRPPAGDEGAQRLAVRARQRRRHLARPVRRQRRRRLRPARRGWRRSWRRATEAFDAYDYTTALEVTEKFFWEFCDDYLELVKERAYDEDGGDATALGPRHPGHRPARPAAAARAVPALRDRGGLVVVAGGLDPPGLLAGRRPTSARRPPPTPRPSTPSPRR